jgi:hypothetical protein
LARIKGLRKVQPHRAARSPFYAEHPFRPLLAVAFVGPTLQDSIPCGAVSTPITNSSLPGERRPNECQQKRVNIPRAARSPLKRSPLGLVPWTAMELMVRDEEHAVRDQSRG